MILVLFYFLNISDKVFFIFKFLYYKKNVYLKFSLFLVKPIQSIPLSDSATPFKALIPVIPHFATLDFKPEKRENVSKAFITSIIECLSPKKNYGRDKQNVRICS